MPEPGPPPAETICSDINETPVLKDPSKTGLIHPVTNVPYSNNAFEVINDGSPAKPPPSSPGDCSLSSTKKLSTSKLVGVINAGSKTIRFAVSTL